MNGREYIHQVKALQPAHVIAYLETHGWREEADEGMHGRHVKRFVHSGTLPEPVEALVPIDDLSGREHLFFEALGSIMTVEQRSLSFILADIQSGVGANA